MIDLHNHVLPNIDDGAKDLEMSISMLQTAAKQGITEVVNTVHYQHPKVESEDISLVRIKKEVKTLQSELDKNDISIKLHMGAEVYFLPNLVEIADDPLATFGHGKYMLVEFQVYHLPDIHRQVLFDLKMKGVTPIIAHPERYKPVQDDLSIASDWLRSGCLLQLDSGSLIGTFGTQSEIAAKQILRNGWCQLIGSDAHNNIKRNFCLDDGVSIAREFIGDSAQLLVDENPRKIIDGQPIKIKDIDSGPSHWITKLSRKIFFMNE